MGCRAWGVLSCGTSCEGSRMHKVALERFRWCNSRASLLPPGLSFDTARTNRLQ
jgi:hypothetical protein